MEFLINKKILLGGSLATIVGVVALEHVGKKLKWDKKPSVLLTAAAEKSSEFWELCGKYVAIASSFYTHIDISEFTATCRNLVVPAAKLVISPFKTIKGYIDTAETYKHPGLIAVGTVTIVFILGGLCNYRYNFITSKKLMNALRLNKFRA